MKRYTVIIDRHDEKRGYGLHVFPADCDRSTVPVRYYIEEVDVHKALTKLNFAERIQTKFLAASNAGGDYQMDTVPLSENVVTEFA
jgi:hypothetical protein